MSLEQILKSVRPSVFQLPPYQAGKMPTVSRSGRQIKLSSNENRYGSSPMVLKALKEAKPEDFFLYPDSYALNLRQALVRHWELNKVHVKESQILLGDGSGEVLDLIFSAFLNRGDTLVIAEKSFSLYRLLSLPKDARVVEVERNADQSVSLDGILDSVISEHAKMVVFSNPDNPTSTFHSSDEIESWMQKIPSDVLVLIDEAYIHFEGISSSVLRLTEHYPNLMVMFTFSKAYALASLRVGYAVMHPELCDIVQRLRLPFNLGYFPQVAALQALKDQEYLEGVLQRIQKVRSDLYEFLLSQDYEAIEPHGNFIFVRLNDQQADLPDFLNKNGVSVRNLSSFGYSEREIRITVGTDEENEILKKLILEYK